jgi:hypothetical protein
MLRGMLVLRGVATTHMPARQAETQVNPGITQLDAFFADVLARAGYLNLILMGAIN